MPRGALGALATRGLTALLAIAGAVQAQAASPALLLLEKATGPWPLRDLVVAQHAVIAEHERDALPLRQCRDGRGEGVAPLFRQQAGERRASGFDDRGGLGALGLEEASLPPPPTQPVEAVLGRDAGEP